MSFWGKLFNKSSDKWVCLGSSPAVTEYYDPTSVIIHKERFYIEVTCKRVYTTKGREMLFDYLDTHNMGRDGLIDVHHSLERFNLDYNEMKIGWCSTIYVSKAGQILEGGGSNILDPFMISGPIQPGPYEILLNILLKDYNIQMVSKDYNIQIKSGGSDDYVFVVNNENLTVYYKSSSVEIDKQDRIITVWTKTAFTDKGVIYYLKKCDSIGKEKYIDIGYLMTLQLIDYKDMKYRVKNITSYSKSNQVLVSEYNPLNWDNITYGSMGDIILNKLIQDYNIQR